MKTLVILGHPSINEGSLANKIIIDELKAVDDISIRDLTTIAPDFKFDIEVEQDALLKADNIILQFPFYWYSVPGILKEWLDQVLSYGFAYGSTGDKLKGKNLIISTTIGGPEESYQSSGYNTYKIEELLTPLFQTANLTGMSLKKVVYTHAMVYIPDVYNVKEEVEERARLHASRVIEALKS